MKKLNGADYADKPVTRDLIKELTGHEWTEFWLEQQIERKRRGLDHYERLIDPVTNEVLAEVK